MAKKSKERDDVLDYPIHNPDDESNGMELIDKEKAGKKANKPSKVQWVSFTDYLKQANQQNLDNNDREQSSDDEKKKKVSEAKSSSPSPSAYGGIGGRSSRKTSWQQPSSGKKTIGSQSSEKSAYGEDPRASLDVKMYKEKMTSKQMLDLENWLKEKSNGEVSVNTIISKAIDNDWDVDTLFDQLNINPGARRDTQDRVFDMGPT